MAELAKIRGTFRGADTAIRLGGSRIELKLAVKGTSLKYGNEGRKLSGGSGVIPPIMGGQPTRPAWAARSTLMPIPTGHW